MEKKATNRSGLINSGREQPLVSEELFLQDFMEFIGKPTPRDIKTLAHIDYLEFETIPETSSTEFILEEGYISYKGNSEIVKIPRTIMGKEVIGIAEDGFAGSFVRAVYIPETVTEIENKAFDQCSNLEQVEFNEGLEKIGRWSFQGCHSLQAISIPSTVCHIDGYAFDECSCLTTVEFNGEIEHIGAYAFSETNIKAIKLPEGISFLANSLFYNCQNLEYVDIPSSVEKILTMTFAGCFNLKYVLLPEKLTSIASQAFQNCDSLTLLTLPTKLPEISQNVFLGVSHIRTVYAVYDKKKKVEVLDPEYYQLLNMGLIKNKDEYRGKFPQRKSNFILLQEFIPSLQWDVVDESKYNDTISQLKEDIFSEYGWRNSIEDSIELIDEELLSHDEEEETEKDLYIEILSEGYNAKHRGELDIAIEKYKEAIEFKPYMHTAYYNLGKVLYAKEDYEAAIRSYKMAISFGQDPYEVLRHIGHALLDSSMLNSLYTPVIQQYQEGINPYLKVQKMLSGNYVHSNPTNKEMEEYDQICISTAERLLILLKDEINEDYS
ncbi:leucine-rich repeat protein [Peribacillus sp. Hz7]|uniref:leucine-rich repeat protein n=1 Tax=Peribacillus sp. Hz7 TaxID=3344873 RepID=UPI0035CC51A8